MNQQEKLKRGQKLAEKAVIIVALLAAAKAIIGLLSNSLVLLSDALHSASDLLPVFASWFSLKIAQKKADERFPYGYYKAENLATAVISGLILYAAYEIFTEGLTRLQIAPTIKMPLLALAVSLVDAILLYTFGSYEEKVGQEINSQSLITMGRENKAHLFSSLAVFVGILLAYYQIPYGEGIITIAISLLILSIGLSAGKDAFFALMDVSPSKEIEEKVTRAIASVPGIEEFFDLRLRKSGPFIFGETKVGVRKFVDVSRAHEIAERVERQIKKKVPQIDSFTIHVEPFQSNFHHLVIPVARKQALNSPVSNKFGRSSYFLFVNLKDKEIKGYYFLKNPYKDRHVRAGLAATKLINKQKSDILITQEIGEISFHALRDNLFDIYQTKARTAQQAIDQFIKGKLKPLHQPKQRNEMEQIAVTGGKGGVGKSTVSILLANKLRSQGKTVILCDCDVECPNDYLLLGQELTNSVKKVFAQFPKLDQEKCDKCLPRDSTESRVLRGGLCVKNCRSNAIFMPPKGFPIFLHELCSGCGLCWHLCPQKAIEIEKKVIGEIFENQVEKNFYLITGRSVGVVDETGPIVTQVRQYAQKLAKKIKADFILSDTSVGLHCGVIRALISSDLAYAVTEPTPLGAHDLRLILALLKKLKVPSQIVLNQADLGNREEIDRIAQESKTKIEYEIPYSKELVKAYSKGSLGKINLTLIKK